MNIDAFEGLTRENMYGELKAWAPEKAKGHSRSAKKTLVALYTEVLDGGLFTDEELNASTPPTPPRVYPDREEGDARFSARVAALDHVHGPGCGHEMERVNPMMPDGIVQLPPDDAVREFVYRDSGKQDRAMTTKQQGLWVQFVKAFKVFQENPAHSGARRTAKAYAYDLKVNGVLVNPKFLETLERGAAHVREVRKMHRAGIDTSDVKTAAREA